MIRNKKLTRNEREALGLLLTRDRSRVELIHLWDAVDRLVKAKLIIAMEEPKEHMFHITDAGKSLMGAA